MTLFKKTLLSCAAILVGAFTVPASAQTAADLGKSLTPLGAIKAGNADGTIPAWTGGIKTPPAGYTKGMHHPDPFASDSVKFKIDASNYQKYKDKLSPGQIAMFERYGQSFFMNIYPTHRSASAPKRIYDASIANSKTAKLVENGDGFTGAKVGVPFPVPQNGHEAMWNHLTRWRGEALTRRVGQANPTASGSYTMVMFEDDLMFPYSLDSYTDDKNRIGYLIQRIVAPARRAGEILLVHETANQIKEPRQAWTYNPGQRRVRKAPNVAYDNPGTGSDGVRTNDQFDQFNGALDRYNWKLIGRKEMYVPYNSYKLHSDQLNYDDIIKPGHINQDYARYEQHRVWVVEGTLKEGIRHSLAKRVFYIDEDSWQILAGDMYDGQGQIWRVQEAHPINYYEVPTFYSTLDISYDLRSGRYTALGFDNQETMYNFDAALTEANFTPSALRREGKR